MAYLITFLFQVPSAGPWWMVLITGSLLLASGILNLILAWKRKDAERWKVAAESAESAAQTAILERNTLRETRDRLQQENTQLVADKKVLEAKTDLNGLRAQVAAKIEELKKEFKEHTEQDLTIANQQITAMQQQTAALEAVKETLKLMQK